MTERVEGCVLGGVVRRLQSLIRPGVHAGVAVVIGMCPVMAKSQATAAPLPGTGQTGAAGAGAVPAPARALAVPATDRLPGAPDVAPIAPVTVPVPLPGCSINSAATLARRRSATCIAPFASVTGRRMPNSSPPMRAAMSAGRYAWLASAPATARRQLSPAGWP